MMGNNPKEMALTATLSNALNLIIIIALLIFYHALQSWRFESANSFNFYMMAAVLQSRVCVEYVPFGMYQKIPFLGMGVVFPDILPGLVSTVQVRFAKSYPCRSLQCQGLSGHTPLQWNTDWNVNIKVSPVILKKLSIWCWVAVM